MQKFELLQKPLLPATNRWELLRNIALFQMKLALDALRDLVISPVSIIAGLADLITGGKNPGHRFYRVLIAGRFSETWINLFGQADHMEPESGKHGGSDIVTIDTIVEQFEKLVVEQYQKGDLTDSAKKVLQRSLERITRGKF